MFRKYLLLAFGFGAPLLDARAELLVVEFSATVSYTQNLPVAGLSPAIGAPMTGYFAYDLTSPDLNPGDPQSGLYSTGHMALNLDGHSVVCDLGQAVVYDVNAPNDLFSFFGGTPLGAAPLVIDGLAWASSYASLNFTEPSGSILTSDALPTAAQLYQLQIDQFNLVQTGTNGVILYDNVSITSSYNPEAIILSLNDVGNDQGRQLRLSWARSHFDRFGSLRPIAQYAIFRRVEPGLKAPAGDWDFVAIVPAFQQTIYNTVVPTLCDTTPLGDCYSTFYIRAMTANASIYFDSGAAAGASIDNLAPSIPLALTLAPAGLLEWTESPEADFDYYTIYGSIDEFLDRTDVVLGHATTPQFDVSGSGDAFFLVTATDFNDNEGAAAKVANNPVDAPELSASRLTLGAIWPNPARSLTNVAYQLPQAARVDAIVFDAMGRQVRMFGSRVRQAGPNLLAWDGRDDAKAQVAAGVYFVRIRADGEELTGRVLRIH